MYSRFCIACVLSCASLLLLLPSPVVSMPAITLKYRLLSRATSRFMVLSESEGINAGGSDIDSSTLICISFEPKELLVRIHSCHDKSLFLGINSTTGKIQATRFTEYGKKPDDAIVLFEVVREDENGINIQLVATVTLSEPCPTLGSVPTEEATGSVPEEDTGTLEKRSAEEDTGSASSAGDLAPAAPKLTTCKVTKRCALAFSTDTEEVIDCLDQGGLSEQDVSKTISLVFSF